MTTVAAFKSDYLTRVITSLETGSSINEIYEKINGKRGGNKIENLLYDWYPEYEGYDYWMVEGHTIECLMDYLECASKIEETTSLQLATIQWRTNSRRSDAYLRNLEEVNIHWNEELAEKYKIKNITVWDIRLLYKKISELQDYLSEFIPETVERNLGNLLLRFKSLEDKSQSLETIFSTSEEPEPSVDSFIENTAAEIVEGPIAAYNPRKDKIQMPPKEQFIGSKTSSATECYYSTLFHELTHWTGAEPRCIRIFGKFGDQKYAHEELVAELGAAFLCADLHITNSPREDHAAYINNWLSVLKRDMNAIGRASNLAQKSVDYLFGLQEKH